MKNEKIIIVGFGWASIGFIQHIDVRKYDITVSPLCAKSASKRITGISPKFVSMITFVCAADCITELENATAAIHPKN